MSRNRRNISAQRSAAWRTLSQSASRLVAAGFAVAPLRREVPLRSRKPHEETFSYRWSRAVQHHPVRSVLAGGAFLLVLALPALSLRLGFADEGNQPEGTDPREAYDLLAEGFGPGFNGPLLLAARVPDGTDPAVLERITDGLFVATLLRVLLFFVDDQHSPDLKYVRLGSTVMFVVFGGGLAFLLFALWQQQTAVRLVRGTIGRVVPRAADKAAEIVDTFVGAMRQLRPHDDSHLADQIP